MLPALGTGDLLVEAGEDFLGDARPIVLDGDFGVRGAEPKPRGVVTQNHPPSGMASMEFLMRFSSSCFKPSASETISGSSCTRSSLISVAV